VHSLGPANAFKQIKEHSTIEAILAAEENKDRYIPVGGDVEAYLDTVRDARNLFLSVPQHPQIPTFLPSSSTAPPDSPSSSFDVDTPLDASSSEQPVFSGSLDPRSPHPDLRALLKRLDLVGWNGLLPSRSRRSGPTKVEAVDATAKEAEELATDLGALSVERDEEGTRVESTEEVDEYEETEDQSFPLRSEAYEADLEQQRRAEEQFERMMV
jgi:hypothetical protein